MAALAEVRSSVTSGTMAIRATWNRSLPQKRDEKLATLRDVQRLSSTIVMKRIVDDRPYPVTPSSGGARR